MIALSVLPIAPAQETKPPDIAPEAGVKLVHRALERRQNQELDGAIEDFSEAIRLDPKRPGLYAMRADTYRSLGRFASAIEDYDEAIRLDPKRTAFYFQRGTLYLLKHEPKMALADAEEEIGLAPVEPAGYTLRARARLQLGDEAGAAADKTKAAELRVPPADEPTRVSSSAMATNLIHRVEPEYPALARQAHVEGQVRFRAIVDTDGSVENVLLVSGHPLLVEAAQAAARQWKYKPTLLNGKAVEVETTIDVTFKRAE